MRLSVIIVSYNVKYYLEQCLASLQKSLKGIDSEVIVFDNHSHDGSVAYNSSLFPNVKYISCSHNLGFAKANNYAIRQSKGDYILLLNPDTIVGESTMEKALSFITSHHEAGAVGVRMMKANGADAKESRRGVPTPLTAFYKFSGLCKYFPRNHRLGKYYMGWLPWDKENEIEVVSGAFFLLRREALEAIGLLDEQFFMYGEDIDLSYRLLKGGWHNWYLPVRILHYKGESTEKSSFRYVHVFYKAMLTFFKKHYSRLSVFITIPIQTAIYAKALCALIHTLNHMARRSLGFVDKSSSANTLYIFFVNPENMKRSQQLASQKGLWAEFHDADKSRKVLSASSANSAKTYAVFDTTAYSYDDIFELMSANKHKNYLLATYYPDKNLVITDSEIIK